MPQVFAVDFHEKITDVEENDIGMGSAQVLFTFTNNYKASVVQGPYTYGGDQGLFELAVFNPSGEMDYNNPVTPDDVAGYLNRTEVVEKLRQLAFLTEEKLQEFRDEKAKVAFRRALEYLYADFKDIREKTPGVIDALSPELRTAVTGILHYFDTNGTTNPEEDEA